MQITTKLIEEYLGIPVFLVGGAVRDKLLGSEIKDYDFASPKDPEEIEKAIREKGRKPFLIGKKFGTVGFRHKTESGEYFHVEITSFRSEKYDKKSRKPEVQFVETIEEDLSRRDFTINAIAIDRNENIIDPHGGQKDLKNKVIKTVGNAKKRFKEDPLRMLRAVRFAARLGFEIEQKTMEAIQEKYYKLLLVSKERWIQELDLILSDENVGRGLDLLMETRLMRVILPEVFLQLDHDQDSPYHEFDLWTHTKKVVEAIPKENLDLRYAGLLHDIGKPFTAIKNKKGYTNYIAHELLSADLALSICKRLKFSKKRTDYIHKTIQNHLNQDNDLKEFDDKAKH